MILTDEMVEKAARALFEDRGFHGWDAKEDHTKRCWRRYARAALLAVLPDVVEGVGDVREIRSNAWQEGHIAGLKEAAEIVKKEADDIGNSTDERVALEDAWSMIQNRITALSPPTEDK